MENTNCDFRLLDTEGSINIWQCEHCHSKVSVLGDGAPPRKRCRALKRTEGEKPNASE